MRISPNKLKNAIRAVVKYLNELLFGAKITLFRYCKKEKKGNQHTTWISTKQHSVWAFFRSLIVHVFFSGSLFVIVNVVVLFLCVYFVITALLLPLVIYPIIAFTASIIEIWCQCICLCMSERECIFRIKKKYSKTIRIFLWLKKLVRRM